MRSYVRTSLGQMHVRRSGSGAPLVLLHRTPDSSLQWADVVPLLAARFDVIALDTAGFGQSPNPPEQPGMEDYARAVIDALDALAVPRAHLLGHRTGSALAVEVAALWPDRVLRLGLSGLADYAPGDRAAHSAHRPLVAPTADGAYLPAMRERTGGHLAPWGSTEQVDRTLLDTLRASPMWHWAGDAVRQQDLHARLSLLQMPVLLIYGSTDRFAARIPALRGMLRTVEAAVIRDGHDLSMEQFPVQFAEACAAFFAG